MAAYRPKSLDDLNNQYDKVKSAEQAIKQGQSKLGAENAAAHGTQRVTWNYDPAKYRVSKEEAAALTGSVDRFIKEFSAKEKPQASALELARQALETGDQAQSELQPETAAAFDALLERAKAETSHAVEQAQQSVAQEHLAAMPIEPAAAEVLNREGGTHHGVYQSAQAPVKEGELSGLMDEYMRVMNDEDADEHGRRFRRRRKDRKRTKEAAADPMTQPVPQPPVVPYGAAPESEAPQDFLAPEETFIVPEEVVAPVEDAFDVPEEVVAPVEDAFDVPEDVVAPVEDAFDAPEEVVAPVEDAFDAPGEVVAPVEDAFDVPEEVVVPVEDAFDAPEEVVAPVEDAFDVPEEVVAPVEDAFDAPEEVVAPVEDEFDASEEVVVPIEDAVDAPEEVVAPVEDAFDAPEEVVVPVEDAFDAPEEVVAPVEDEFDAPEEVVVPVEDAFDAPEEVVAPVEDEFDAPEEVVVPVEDVFDTPEEVTEPVEDASDIPVNGEMFEEEAKEALQEEADVPAEEAFALSEEPAQALEEDDFIFPEEFLMPVFEPEEPAFAAPEETAPEAAEPEAPEQETLEEPFQEAFDETLPEPLDEPEQEVVIPLEEDLMSADENGEETDAFAQPQAFDDLPEDAQTDDYVPQFAAPAETDELLGEEAAYPAQFEDVMSYSGDADPEDRFVPAEEQPQETAEADEAPETAPEPILDPQPEADEAPQEAPAVQAPRKKEHRFLRGIGKFFCSIFLIVSLLATVCVALLGTVLGINSGKPTIGDYYLFTASNTYEGTAVDEGDLVLCQKTNAIPNEAGVVYIDAQSHSFSFGVKRSDRVDSAQNTMVYDVSGVSVTKENLLGTVVQTLPKVGVYVRYIIDHFVPLLCGCAALDVLWILLLILLSHRRRDVEEAADLADAPQDDLYGDI